LFFSSDAASIVSVIPAMDKLNNGLDPKSKIQYHPAIKAAMRLAQMKMNQYYSLTDSLPLYRIAMGMYLIYLFA
jgi:hypothetical protein